MSPQRSTHPNSPPRPSTMYPAAPSAILPFSHWLRGRRETDINLANPPTFVLEGVYDRRTPKKKKKKKSHKLKRSVTSVISGGPDPPKVLVPAITGSDNDGLSAFAWKL
ncbi:hypothetical protein GX48_05757 [Paracoccidioides brasiliensis]|nr:hypothetical protein GX48_05757 [Paracoccidioides brasiliensis]